MIEFEVGIPDPRKRRAIGPELDTLVLKLRPGSLTERLELSFERTALPLQLHRTPSLPPDLPAATLQSEIRGLLYWSERAEQECALAIGDVLGTALNLARSELWKKGRWEVGDNPTRSLNSASLPLAGLATLIMPSRETPTHFFDKNANLLPLTMYLHVMLRSSESRIPVNGEGYRVLCHRFEVCTTRQVRVARVLSQEAAPASWIWVMASAW